MDFTVEWGGKYHLCITGVMGFGFTLSKNVFCTLGSAITLAKIVLESYEHHGLNSLDIIDENTGEVHCTVKRG